MILEWSKIKREKKRDRKMKQKSEYGKESEHLDSCVKIIEKNIVFNNSKIKELIDSIDTSLNEYFNGDNKSNVDYASIGQSDEFAALSRDLLNEKSFLDLLLKENARLEKMRKSPFFAKVVFNGEDYYIGISTVFDGEDIVIVDWRAPLADLYYESELGEAFYKVKNKVIKGQLSLKRQFIIENGKLVDYVDGNLSIDDPILISELSKNGEDKLKNIVSTIQMEQNKAIKASVDDDLLVIGVAGSGKTSVAIHRISYLIYKNSEIYSSNKIAMLSPNNFFFHYIDNILPSLGEDNVINFDISYLIDMVLSRYGYKCLKKDDFYEKLFDNYNEKNAFVYGKEAIDEVVSKSIKRFIKDTDLIMYGFCITYQEICDFFAKNIVNHRLATVITMFKKYVLEKLEQENVCMSKEEKKEVFEAINHIFLKFDYLDILNELVDNKYQENDVLEFYDGVYLAYIILKIHRLKIFDNFNHLVIDEVQDYSGIEMEIINMLLGCKKTMVGDINQKLNVIDEAHIKNCTRLELLHSYRSSKQIFDFINSLIVSDKTASVLRDGNKPVVSKCLDFDREVQRTAEIINMSKGSVAVICKNNIEKEKWYGALKNKVNIKKIKSKDNGRAVISTIYECKGIEFDNVIVVDVDKNNYVKNIENNWLYIACSRAMHNLYLLYCGDKSNFIKSVNGNYYEEEIL